MTAPAPTPVPSPATLQLDGELTIYRASELKPQLLAALPGAAAFDLSQVSEIDTAGVQLLLLAQREAGSRGVALALAAASAPVRDAFALLGLGGRLAAA